MMANQTMQLVGSWSGLGRVLVGSWATLGHFWGTLGRFLGTLGPIGRALDGIRVNGDLDSVRIVLFRDDRFGEVVLLPMSVEIGKARAGTFAGFKREIRFWEIARGSALRLGGTPRPTLRRSRGDRPTVSVTRDA